MLRIMIWHLFWEIETKVKHFLGLSHQQKHAKLTFVVGVSGVFVGVALLLQKEILKRVASHLQIGAELQFRKIPQLLLDSRLNFHLEKIDKTFKNLVICKEFIP